MIIDQLGGRIEREQEIHGRGHLECAFVTMALGPFDPFRIRCARAYHPVQLFLEGADLRQVGLAVIAMITGGLLPAEAFRSGEHAALKLVVVI